MEIFLGSALFFFIYLFIFLFIYLFIYFFLYNVFVVHVMLLHVMSLLRSQIPTNDGWANDTNTRPVLSERNAPPLSETVFLSLGDGCS